MRISDWSSDVCSSDLPGDEGPEPDDRMDQQARLLAAPRRLAAQQLQHFAALHAGVQHRQAAVGALAQRRPHEEVVGALDQQENGEEDGAVRSEEHTSELQSLMRNSYAVFCLQKK